MNYHGGVALLTCSLGVLAAALALQFVGSDLPSKDRRGVPLGLLAVALAAFLLALSGLRAHSPAQGQTMAALALTGAMMTGVLAKWLCETAAQRKVTLHEKVLALALLAAPIAVLLCGQIFPRVATPTGLAFWFFNGYFWHALFSDIERMATPEKIVIRRREPPTLPHDFRKPEID